ncbi:LysR family transcriptional regulator [Actinomadura rupiterrae]|uniref:LysR family transcriptional regulator n=1 Tax=Actinomadura rupiterrae TaxID=559627 RepID=UPI0020A305A3|nr:LysR family transcriptional regulator [Actinomadura rupiterrae]MCP2335440.1 DNA-binding transcriptional LysR family regulator [Actinomadura rupiterrae]
MDLDLAQVRAFVATAEARHFGHAATDLGLTQQALSKRIARLEALLGTRLLERGHGSVEPTPAGERFLAPARRALAAADAAISAVRDEAGPLRVDLWGHLYDPSRTLSDVINAPHSHELPPGRPDRSLPAIELGRARDLPAVASALLRGEIDAGFGRVHRSALPPAGGLTHRIVRLEPMDALLSDRHPLARTEQLRPGDLRDSRLLFPAAADRLDFLSRFAEAFEIRDRIEAVNLGAGRLLADLRDTPDAFTLFPADARLPDVPGIRSVPLVDPVPLYAWSVIWNEAAGHPRLPDLLQALTAKARTRRWLEYNPCADWLPTEDTTTYTAPPLT